MINFTDNRSCEKCIAPYCFNVGKKNGTPCIGFIDKYENTTVSDSTVTTPKYVLGIDISKSSDSK